MKSSPRCVGECGLQQINCACIVNRRASGYINHQLPLPSSRDTRWTYMYKVDLRCAAVPSLVTHCSEWLQVCVSLISTHHGQLFILWLRVGHRKNREQRLQPRYNRILVIPKRVITSFQYSSSISISAGSTVVRGWTTVSLGATRRL